MRRSRFASQKAQVSFWALALIGISGGLAVLAEPMWGLTFLPTNVDEMSQRQLQTYLRRCLRNEQQLCVSARTFTTNREPRQQIISDPSLLRQLTSDLQVRSEKKEFGRYMCGCPPYLLLTFESNPELVVMANHQKNLWIWSSAKEKWYLVDVNPMFPRRLFEALNVPESELHPR